MVKNRINRRYINENKLKKKKKITKKLCEGQDNTKNAM